MLRSILRAAAAATSRHQPYNRNPSPILSFTSNYSAKTTKSAVKKAPKKGKSKGDGKANDDPSASAASDDLDAALFDDKSRARRLAAEENDHSLDVGPNGRPLFTSASSLSQLTRKDAGTYFKFNMEGLNEALPEGLPLGMVKEFEDSMRSALLVRQNFLDLRDNFRRVVDPSLLSPAGSNIRKQIVLDGPVNSGKSIALAMLVHWARDEGWLVFYVPSGRRWTHGGFFYKNAETGLWDTPVQAEDVLRDFLKYNETRLRQLPCQLSDPIPLGEGVGVRMKKGADSMMMPEGSTLYDLIDTGIKHTHAAVGVVVRLRKELSLVKDIPVLFAIDQYNNWFTFSEFEEPVTVRSTRPIHARELAMVKAFRSMMHDDMMVGAFSHSTAVGKLRQDLPDVPLGARVNFPRYNLDEAASVFHYYLRQRLIRREAFSEDAWKKVYYLSNGNGAEMRWLVPLMR
ncbi:28S ribosomal protein S29, mitochondrial, partial [Cucurbita argyrosperma subsp. sororia]